MRTELFTETSRSALSLVCCVETQYQMEAGREHTFGKGWGPIKKVPQRRKSHVCGRSDTSSYTGLIGRRHS